MRAMKRALQRLFNYRIRALTKKEFNQIRRDRRLASSLILPPTVQLLLFGFALSANVSNLRELNETNLKVKPGLRRPPELIFEP